MDRIFLHSRRWLRSLRKGEAGQALVEFALTGSLLSVLVLGAIEFGRGMYAAIEVANAAKAAAQYAAMNGGAYADTTGIQNAANADAYDAVNALGMTLTTTPTYACSCTGTGDTCTNNTAPNPPTGCTTSHLIVTVTVHTTATFTPVIHLPGFPNSIPLRGDAVAEVIP